MSLAELTADQIRRVVAFLDDEWVDPDDDQEKSDRALDAILDAVESPLELHFCALFFNWDTSVDELRRIATHPLCDRGTALAIFWMGQPAFYYERSRSELNEDNLEVRALLESIEERSVGGHYASESIRVDPSGFDGEDWTADARAGSKWDRVIPPLLFEPSPGEAVAAPPALRRSVRA